jgi:voltage-gated potassium channel Kch
MHLLGAEPMFPPIATLDAEEMGHGSFLDRHAIKIVASFLFFGWIIFHFVEGFSWIDSWYFVCITLTTVGYGDFSPQTHAGRIIAIVYIVFGLSFVASSLGTVAANLAGSLAQEEDRAVMRERMSSKLLTRSSSYKDRPSQGIATQTLNAVGILSFSVLVGAVFIHFAEGIHPVDATYWAVVTMSSVGYGDIAITHPTTRLFVSIYALVGVACTG